MYLFIIWCLVTYLGCRTVDTRCVSERFDSVFCIVTLVEYRSPEGERETFVLPPKNVHVLSRISSVFSKSSKKFFSCVEPSEFSIFMFSCENHLSIKTFFMCRAK